MMCCRPFVKYMYKYMFAVFVVVFLYFCTNSHCNSTSWRLVLYLPSPMHIQHCTQVLISSLLFPSLSLSLPLPSPPLPPLSLLAAPATLPLLLTWSTCWTGWWAAMQTGYAMTSCGSAPVSLEATGTSPAKKS